ncbi:MAG: hypothetical protein H6627_10455 [Calditrichae bacterium]|nr:hypothetical protein [Calditrichia bacterium]
MKRLLFIIVLLLLTGNVFAQSKPLHQYFNSWNQNTEDAPSVDVDVAMQRLGFGYPYVEGMLKSVEINGYWYKGNYYSTYELEKYGFVFPVKAKSPIAKVTFDAGITNVFIEHTYDNQFDLYTKVKSSREIPFSQDAKDRINQYAKENDFEGGGAAVWEEYGYISGIEIIEISSPTFSDIRSAIRELLKDNAIQKKKEEIAEKRETKARDKRIAKQVEQHKTTFGYAMDYYSKAVAAYNAGEYSLAKRYVDQGLSIDPSNRYLKSLSYKVNQEAAVQGFSNGMMALSNEGISAGFVYNNLSGIGLVFGYHTGNDDFTGYNQPDDWSLLFSAGLIPVGDVSGYQTYSAIWGIPFEIENPFSFIPLPLIVADYLAPSVGLSYVTHGKKEEVGYSIGLQDITGSIGFYGQYDTISEFEFGFFAAF